MTVNIDRSCFCYLKPFMFFLRFFGMFPYSGKPDVHKAYVLVLIMATIFGYVVCTVAKETWLFTGYPKVMKFVDQTYNAYLLIVCVVSQVCMVFLYPQKIQNLLHDISITDTTDIKGISSKCVFWIAFCVCSFGTIFILSIDTVIWLYTVGFDRYKYYILRNIQYYQTNMMLLFEMWLCLEQRNRFKYLNDQLKNTLEQFISADCKKNSKEIDRFQVAVEVKNMKKSHNRLCNIAECFNEMFGALLVLQVIFLISIVISYTLNVMHYLLVLNDEIINVFLNTGSDERVTAGEIQNMHFNLAKVNKETAFPFVLFNDPEINQLKAKFPANDLGSSTFSSRVLNLAKLFALAGVGELFYQEAHKATGICYDSINELEFNRQLESDVLKQQLFAFVQQVRDRNPKMAASSCFDIRLGMMGFVIASVTSYIIVAVQFMVQ
nr:unnamed protein product [Callosobruchus chinensis]